MEAVGWVPFRFLISNVANDVVVPIESVFAIVAGERIFPFCCK